MGLYNTLRDALYDSSKNYIEDELVFSHEGGAEPKGPYASMNILRADKIGWEDQSTYAKGTTDIRSVSVYEVVVRYMFIGDGSGDLAYEFETAIDNPAARFAFGTQNLAIMRKSEIRRVPEKRDTDWVDFFTLDVIFSYAVENTQPIDIIEEVNFTNNI